MKLATDEKRLLKDWLISCPECSGSGDKVAPDNPLKLVKCERCDGCGGLCPRCRSRLHTPCSACTKKAVRNLVEELRQIERLEAAMISVSATIGAKPTIDPGKSLYPSLSSFGSFPWTKKRAKSV